MESVISFPYFTVKRVLGYKKGFCVATHYQARTSLTFWHSQFVSVRRLKEQAGIWKYAGIDFRKQHPSVYYICTSAWFIRHFRRIWLVMRIRIQLHLYKVFFEAGHCATTAFSLYINIVKLKMIFRNQSTVNRS